MISLAKLSPHLASNDGAQPNPSSKAKPEKTKKEAVVVDFSGEAVSEESSDSSESDSE